MAATYPGGVKSFTTKTDGPGQTIFAAHVNDIQDEIVAIETDLLAGGAHQFDAGTVTAPGVAIGDSDVGLYSSGTNALDFSTNGVKALGIDATQFIDSPTQPRASAYNSATQSHAATGTWVVVTFDTEDFDVGGLHDTGSNTDRMTVPTGGDGLYYVSGQTSWAASATGIRGLRFTKNGTAFLREAFALSFSSSGTGPAFGIDGIAVLAAGDIVRLEAFQDTGGSTNLGNATTQLASRLQLMKVW